MDGGTQGERRYGTGRALPQPEREATVRGSAAPRGQRGLDVILPGPSGVDVRIVERPGRWLSDEGLAALVGEMQGVARAAVPAGELAYGVLTGERMRMRDVLVTLLYDRRSGRPAGFSGMTFLRVEVDGRGEEVLHLGLGVVDPDFRNRGLCGTLYAVPCLLAFLRNGFRPYWVSNVSQVPAVVGLVAEAFADVAPSFRHPSRPAPYQRKLARAIMKEHRAAFGVGEEARFDARRFVITGAYTGGSDPLKKSYEEAPKHRTSLYNVACRRELDYERGDDFLQVGRYGLGTLLFSVRREGPRTGLVRTAFRGSGRFLAAARDVALRSHVRRRRPPTVTWEGRESTPWGG